MKGQLLDYSVQTNSGVISGQDGSRYTFVGSEWKGEVPPSRGMQVDFDVDGASAMAVYRDASVAQAGASSGAKNGLAAGLLAIFLGALGIHKFYLGYTGPGLVYLLTNTIGWIVTIFFLGIPNIILGLIALVEGIIYLTKSDEDFERIYVVNRRPWF